MVDVADMHRQWVDILLCILLIGVAIIRWTRINNVDIQELRIRLDERKKLFTASPQMQLTYSDAVMIIEYMETILDNIEQKKEIGLNGGTTENKS